MVKGVGRSGRLTACWVGIGTAALLACAATATATVGWLTDSWSAAAQRAGFALLYPRSAFGLKPELYNNKGPLLVVSCASPAGAGSEVLANWGQSQRRMLFLAQTDTPARGWTCSNPGVAGLIKRVAVNGNTASLTGYCYPALKRGPSRPLPSCSSRSVGFYLTWHQGAAWIQAESYGFTYRELIAWVRQLRAVAPKPLLGSRSYAHGRVLGLGSVAPKVINANGDANSVVLSIHWRHWGAGRAYGYGESHEFAPHGGYLPGLFPVQLIASDLGRCSSRGPLVYRHLRRRDRGGSGTWSSWTSWPPLQYPAQQLLC
jgi:hypothetical protein